MKEDPCFHLFVYGSLRSGFHSPAYEYISRYFDLVSEGKVKGKLYDMGEYPAAIPDNGDHYIIGELYVIKNRDEFSWAMGQLDDYEGLTVEAGETPEYRRDIAIVYTTGKETRSWIYWYHGNTEGRPVIESGDLIKYIESRK